MAELQVSYSQNHKTSVLIEGSYDAYKVFRQMWNKSLINIQEQFCAIFLNPDNEVIGFRVITTGKLSSGTIDIQLLFSCALLCRAAGTYVAHNHPSGAAVPSQSDEIVTREIKRAAKYLDLKLFDHLVITEEGYFSISDNEIVLAA